MKYKITDETINFCTRILHRIECVETFRQETGVFTIKGEKGGWIENETNLSQDGNCWISGDAIVFDNAHIFENAVISGQAIICDNAIVYGNATVNGNSYIGGNTRIYDNANVYGNVMVLDNAQIYGDANISDLVKIYDNAKISSGNVNGNATIRQYAEISSEQDYIVFQNFFDNGNFITYTFSNKCWSFSGFYGTDEQLIYYGFKKSLKIGLYYILLVAFIKKLKVLKNN